MENHEKRGYLLENFRLFHLRSQAGTTVSFHYHEFCKLLLLVSGRGSYYVDGQHYLLCPEDIVLIGSHTLHKPELDESEPYERIILYVSPAYLQQVSTTDCDLLSLFSGKQGHVLRLKEPQRRLLFQLAVTLERDLSQEGFGREILSEASLLRLLVELGRSMEKQDTSLPSPAMPKSKRNYEIMRYLDQNLAETIDMDHLADTFFVSKFYMMRSFHQETGSTILGYLTQKRLMQAQELMNGGMSATEACYRSGFRSYSSFTRAYGKYYGTTPTGRMDKRMVRAEDYE